MRVGNMIFKWSGDNEHENISDSNIVVKDIEQPLSPIKEDIAITPGTKEYIETPPSFLSVVPGMMSGVTLDDVLETYTEPEQLVDAKNAATVAKRNPMAYLAGEYMKERFYHPITAWVLDNEVMGNPERIVYFFAQYSRRIDPGFEPWVHEGAKFLLEHDPLTFLDATSAWAEASGVAGSLARYLPNLFETILRMSQSDEYGQLFREDLNTQSKFHKLGRKIGNNALIGGEEGKRYKQFFTERVAKVLRTRIAIEKEKYKRLLDMGADPKSTMMRRYRAAIQGWRNNLGSIYIKVSGGKSLHEATDMRIVFRKLAEIASLLDIKGGHIFANELDLILSNINRNKGIL